jgi:N utilization substance protein A
MDKSLAGKLAVKRHQDARRSGRSGVDELTEMTGIDADRAKQLITTARAHWFE